MNPEAPKLWLISWSGAAVDTGMKSGNCASPSKIPDWLLTTKLLGDVFGNLVDTNIGDDFGVVEIKVGLGDEESITV